MACLVVFWPHSEALGLAEWARQTGVWSDAWARRSLLAPPLPRGLVHNPNRPLGSRIDVNVPNLDCLAVPAPVAIKRLDQIGLHPEQPEGIPAVHVDEVFGHLPVALSEEAHTRKPGGHNLHGQERFQLRLGLDGADEGQTSIQGWLVELFGWGW